MTRLFVFLTVVSQCVLSVLAQDTITPYTDLCHKKAFTYRYVHHEYIDNGNNFFVANHSDTTFLRFENTGKPLVFSIKTSLDESGKKRIPNADTLHRIIPVVEFTERGKIKELKNWKTFRDVIISFYSAQVRASVITSTEFKELRDSVNKENVVRRMVIDDINYMFSLSEDTFNTDLQYLRVKSVRSPMSDMDYLLLGNLTVERMPGTKNTVVLKAQNKAGAGEKPLLLEEAKQYLRSKTPANEPVSEIKSVGLNSEQLYQYNIAQGRMIRIEFADVLALDMSSRGNIREYYLWDIVE